MNSRTDALDMYRGVLGKTLEWLETVRDLKTAQERMEQLAAKKPDAYFVLNPKDHSVVAQINTAED